MQSEPETKQPYATRLLLSEHSTLMVTSRAVPVYESSLLRPEHRTLVDMSATTALN